LTPLEVVVDNQLLGRPAGAGGVTAGRGPDGEEPDERKGKPQPVGAT
jgi:hypothetical protein